MDAIFKALSDDSRRAILDQLRHKDGQTLSELEAHFPGMSRFGVMKHLNVLEDAYLITTVKNGRFKHHYLNAAPLHEIANRWIANFAMPWAATMTHLKQTLERNDQMSTKPHHVYVTIIRTTPEKLWAALTDGTITPLYYYGGRIETNLTPGTPFNYMTSDGHIMVGGTIIEATPPKKLVTSFTGNWDPAMAKDKPSRVTWQIDQQGDCCRLSLIHDEFETETPTWHIVGGGWPGILSGLKTLLETGNPLGYDPMAA